jgi:hypothetical protein
MKLNLHAKELLALHNLLKGALSTSAEGDPDAATLQQVYNRLRACIITSLSNRVQDPVEAFFDRQQQKIDRLRDAEHGAAQPQEVMPAGEDVSLPEGYPRRSQGNRQGKHRRR